jgi:hypothetical protein
VGDIVLYVLHAKDDWNVAFAIHTSRTRVPAILVSWHRLLIRPAIKKSLVQRRKEGLSLGGETRTAHHDAGPVVECGDRQACIGTFFLNTHVLGLGRERFGFSVFYPRVGCVLRFFPCFPRWGRLRKDAYPWVGPVHPLPACMVILARCWSGFRSTYALFFLPTSPSNGARQGSQKLLH